MKPNRENFKPRGSERYCKARPCILDKNGNIHQSDYSPTHWKGIRCACHGGEEIPTLYWVAPSEWQTTPAEADVDPTRPRVVRFERNPVRSTKTISRWWNNVWPSCRKSQDPATEAEDDADIHAMDNQPAANDFNSTWQALMDAGFPDDDDYC